VKVTLNSSTLENRKTNFPCLLSVAIILVSGCFLNNALAASLVTLSVAHKPNDSQNLIFETVEVIAHDSNKQRADLKKECLDFLKTRSWKESDKSVFRVNTPEGYEALNLESNGKNKYNIILSIGEDKVTKDAANASVS
jgi:hypothetical protein